MNLQEIKIFLKETAYPIMKGAAQFCLDFLVENKDGLLVTAPSFSPENNFIDDKGKKGSASIATTMDMSIIWDLFTNIIAASGELNVDQPFRDLIIAKTKSIVSPCTLARRATCRNGTKIGKTRIRTTAMFPIYLDYTPAGRSLPLPHLPLPKQLRRHWNYEAMMVLAGASPGRSISGQDYWMATMLIP